MTADEQGHNGWTNYETWCVSLWLGNEEGLYLATHEIARRYGKYTDVYRMAEDLREYVENLPGTAAVLEKASFVSDLLGAALNSVDWEEIARHLLDEVAEEEA